MCYAQGNLEMQSQECYACFSDRVVNQLCTEKYVVRARIEHRANNT